MAGVALGLRFHDFPANSEADDNLGALGGIKKAATLPDKKMVAWCCQQTRSFWLLTGDRGSQRNRTENGARGTVLAGKTWRWSGRTDRHVFDMETGQHLPRHDDASRCISSRCHSLEESQISVSHAFIALMRQVCLSRPTRHAIHHHFILSMESQKCGTRTIEEAANHATTNYRRCAARRRKLHKCHFSNTSSSQPSPGRRQR